MNFRPNHIRQHLLKAVREPLTYGNRLLRLLILLRKRLQAKRYVKSHCCVLLAGEVNFTRFDLALQRHYAPYYTVEEAGGFFYNALTWARY